jgi:hypothetical protein
MDLGLCGYGMDVLDLKELDIVGLNVSLTERTMGKLVMAWLSWQYGA